MAKSRNTWGWCLGVLVASCSPKSEPARGQLIVAIDTDMAIPKDLDKLGVQVDVFRGDEWQPKLEKVFAIAPSKSEEELTFLPATLAIVAGENASEAVRIQIRGLSKRGDERVLRRVITTVPDDRIALLRMPLSWACLDELECDDSESCVLGRCTDATVESSELPSYEPRVVFGGADTPNGTDGRCFSVEACFAESTTVVPSFEETDYCQVALEVPAGGAINLAVRGESGSEGICGDFDGDAHCYVPLTQSEWSGWTELSPPTPTGRGSVEHRLQLPPGICDRLHETSDLAVRATFICASKTDSVGACGEWSSLQKPLGAPPAEGGGGGGSGGQSSVSGSGGSGATDTSGASGGGAVNGGASPGVGGMTMVAGNAAEGGKAGSALGGGGSGGSGVGYPCQSQTVVPALLAQFTSLEPKPDDEYSIGQLLVDLPEPGGATFAYPSPGPITLSNPEGTLNARGTVADYTGFGIYFDQCVDGSKFSGISFKIRGNVTSVGFRITINENYPVNEDYRRGTCFPRDPKDPFASCLAPTAWVSIGPDVRTVQLSFTEFAEGKPLPTVRGTSIVGFEWALPWSESQAPYDFDVTIDDLQFTGGTP